MEANQQDVEEHAERPEVDLRKIPRRVAPGSEKIPRKFRHGHSSTSKPYGCWACSHHACREESTFTAGRGVKRKGGASCSGAQYDQVPIPLNGSPNSAGTTNHDSAKTRCLSALRPAPSPPPRPASRRCLFTAAAVKSRACYLPFQRGGGTEIDQLDRRVALLFTAPLFTPPTLLFTARPQAAAPHTRRRRSRA